MNQRIGPVEQESPPRLLADRMVGKLARWLRLLGYDTAYLPQLSPQGVITEARRQGRIILTRDSRIIRGKDAGSLVFIEDDHFREQICQVVKDLRLDPVAHLLTRCSECNALLQPIAKVIVDLVRDPSSFARVIQGIGAKSMADWPMIDRTLWPKPAGRNVKKKFNWPLEPECGWGPPAVATVLTSRVCPWNCVFCNESSYMTNITRKPVEMVIDELNFLDKKYGPVGSVVILDSLFFQNRQWLEEWLDKYPVKTRKLWPYWAAGRSDTVRKWPELFSDLIRETNWMNVSIGFESGSDRVLRILNKQCTEDDNYFTIDLVNKIGDDLEARPE